MTLLLCSGCRDVVALQMDTKRTCKCGSSSGQYHADGWDADVWGPQAVLLGLRNQYLPTLVLGQGADPGDEYATVGVYCRRADAEVGIRMAATDAELGPTCARETQ